MNVENLKLENNKFDKVISIETLEHVLNPDKAIKELSRVLKPQGILVITYPLINETIMKKLGRIIGIKNHISVSEHLTEWDYNELIRKIEKNNFKLEKSEGIVFDLGILNKLKYISKNIMGNVLKIQLLIKNFPRNSYFVALKFRKI